MIKARLTNEQKLFKRMDILEGVVHQLLDKMEEFTHQVDAVLKSMEENSDKTSQD